MALTVCMLTFLVLLQETSAVFHDTVGKFMPTGLLELSKHPTLPSVAELINPASFALKAEKVSFSTEHGMARTVRLTCSGSRDIYMASAWAVAEFLASTAVDRKWPALKDVAKWMRDLTEASVLAFMKANKDNKARWFC
jgi:hypothetical protein